MGSLDERVALVTGAGSGMGRASAEALAAAGAKVLVTDVNGDTATATAAAITAAGGSATAAVLDIADEASWEEAVAAARRAFSAPVTVLHNNAALTGGPVMDLDRDPLHLDLGAWNTSLSITLTGAALGCKHVLPGMLEAGKGSIINMSSTRGVTGATWRMSYNTAKAGIIGLTRTVAVHYGARACAATPSCPGLRHPRPAQRPARGATARGRALASAEPGRPAEEMAQAVVFLASDLSSFITGAVIPVDGGQTAFSEGLAPAVSRGIED
ncbi:SDR family NAD(P)-dependent oxidoreductase [Streptomyces sp. INA 01156]